jgi:predicted HicB family RNase H-like nuclease
MADRSQTKDDFLGLYIRSEVKERARQRANEQGISLSEFVRRRLSDLDKAAGRPAATT